MMEIPLEKEAVFMEQKEIKKGWQGFVPGLWMEEIRP